MSDQQALSILMKTPVTQEMIQHIVNVTLKVIQCKKSTTTLPSPPSSPSKAKTSLPSLMTFISRLVRYTKVYTGTLLATLVYLERLSTKLPKNAEGLPCTLHRIFLACLIISSKFNNDSSPKNHHWAQYTDGMFKSEDVNLMERQLLNLLNWDVMVSNQDLTRCLKRFIDPIKSDLKKASRVRRSISKQRLHQQYSATINNSQYSRNVLPSPTTSPKQQQQAAVSPVSYNDAYLANHLRSLSTSSVSSLSSSSSDSSLDMKLHTQQTMPQYVYYPQKMANSQQPQHQIQSAYSYTFNQDELNNYVPITNI